jgi:hypothetical protein
MAVLLFNVSTVCRKSVLKSETLAYWLVNTKLGYWSEEIAVLGRDLLRF